MMKSLGSLTIMFLVAISQYCSVVVGDPQLITTTCKQTPFYQLCVSTLQSDPKSRSADVAGLGLIVVNVVKAKITDTLTQIRKLQVSSPQLRDPLNNCSQLYNLVVNNNIPEAIEALTKGDPKFAEEGMSDAALEAQVCENGFKNSKSPLTNRNKSVHDLSLVATAIARILL